MKKIFTILISITILGASIYFINPISDYIIKLISSTYHTENIEKGKYYKDYGTILINNTEEFTPYSYEDVLNIFYTLLNNHVTSYTFYCPNEYSACIKDIEKLTNNKLENNDTILLNYINNIVHPYNSFYIIRPTIYSNGEIVVNIEYNYSDYEIDVVEKRIDSIIENEVDINSTDEEKIKSIHDYIINNTVYDTTYEKGLSESTKAYGLLVNNKAICSGYADTMAIALYKLGIKNFKISTTSDDISYESDGHVWNAVYINGKWKHLDLTWDDPVSSDGKNYLFYKYFLVNNEEMKKSDTGSTTLEEHNFKKNLYLEFNDSI